jgi:hypothetical protein
MPTDQTMLPPLPLTPFLLARLREPLQPKTRKYAGLGADPATTGNYTTDVAGWQVWRLRHQAVAPHCDVPSVAIGFRPIGSGLPRRSDTNLFALAGLSQHLALRLGPSAQVLEPGYEGGEGGRPRKVDQMAPAVAI